MWTTDEVTSMVDLANKGLTSTQIAGRLINKSRNAVIGKLARLGIALAGSKKVAVVAAPKKVGQKRIRQWLDARANFLQRSRAPAPVSTNDKECGTLALVELESHHCRWPYGEKDFTFCGRDKYLNSPYCLDHTFAARKTRL